MQSRKATKNNFTIAEMAEQYLKYRIWA